jgi:hypothetical protein
VSRLAELKNLRMRSIPSLLLIWSAEFIQDPSTPSNSALGRLSPKSPCASQVGVANYLSFDSDDGGMTMSEQKAGPSNAAQIEFWNSAASRAWTDEHERMDRAVAR